jgi:hypothetical protein
MALIVQKFGGTSVGSIERMRNVAQRVAKWRAAGHDIVVGMAEDIPIPADFDGDGKADVTVFRPSTNVWYRVNSSNGEFSARVFGQNGDKPSPVSVQPQ